MIATLYVKTGCPYCAAMRDDLRASGVDHEEINISEHREVIPELLKLTKGHRVVPVLVDDAGVQVAPNGG